MRAGQLRRAPAHDPRRARAALHADDRRASAPRAARERLRFARPQGGLYLWCRLASGISSRALLDRALAAGVAFVPGHAFYPDPGRGIRTAPVLLERDA